MRVWLFVFVCSFVGFQALAQTTSSANNNVNSNGSGSGHEMVMHVWAKRHFIRKNQSTSSTQISHKLIQALPGGDNQSLPQLITTTTPGVVPGPFGQMFFRGNHANIQYQVDGVQLPDSPSNSLGQVFSPRNIDHMNVITGGIPAQYGQRLAAVVNIVTKSGPEKPGGALELNYGSYNKFSPAVTYGGSNPNGNIHYYLSASYNRTDRGLDTPEPKSSTNFNQGGADAVHDYSQTNNEFVKVDDDVNNTNTLSVILFNSDDFYEIPNFPSSFSSTLPMFSTVGYVDPFGNTLTNGAGTTTYNYVPANTDDWQAETDAYIQTVWKHTFNDRNFMYLSPYYKYSEMVVGNDPSNDLITASGHPDAITGAVPSSFAENRHVNNYGIKGDFTDIANDRNVVKYGFQTQYSQAMGDVSLQVPTLFSGTSTDNGTDAETYEGFYGQDDYTIRNNLILNGGLRFDATQFNLPGNDSYEEQALQPRIGVNYLPNPITKLHAFYGRLFQPAPLEDLRATFDQALGSLAPYNIRAEQDNYYEVGATRAIGTTHAIALNLYYKDAINMLDDQQLFNSNIAQPFNFAHGFAYGVEFSLKGNINANWSDYLNYAYEIAKGKGISGGTFTGATSSGTYEFLDHVQIDTANAGVTYEKHGFWWTGELLYGSGLRTGPNNENALTPHLTANMTVGQAFTCPWINRKMKASLDLMNVTNDAYPIMLDNGFNGSHYAAGFEIMSHLSFDI